MIYFLVAGLKHVDHLWPRKGGRKGFRHKREPMSQIPRTRFKAIDSVADAKKSGRPRTSEEVMKWVLVKVSATPKTSICRPSLEVSVYGSAVWRILYKHSTPIQVTSVTPHFRRRLWLYGNVQMVFDLVGRRRKLFP